MKTGTSHPRMTILNHGRMFMNVSDLERLDNVAEGKVAAKQIEIPIYSVLIDHPDGLVLFDTGCHPCSMGERGRWPLSLQKSCPWVATPEQSIQYQLELKGVHPRDIRYVVCSHLHCDHAGNLEFFPEAEIIVHADEWTAATKEHQAQIREGEFVYEDMSAWIERGLNIRLVQPDTDSTMLLPGVTVHNLGRGHSYGMLALQVDLLNKTVLLASDAAFAERYYGPDAIVPLLSVDSAGYLRGVKKLEHLVGETEAEIWFGHDMPQFEEITLPQWYS